jgi:hypothetical protein
MFILQFVVKEITIISKMDRCDIIISACKHGFLDELFTYWHHFVLSSAFDGLKNRKTPFTIKHAIP